MNFETAPTAMKAFFAAGWGNTTPLIYEDVKVERPDVAHAKIFIRHVDGYAASMGDTGNNRQRRIGNITIQIFVPENDATREATRLGEQAAKVFIGKQYQGITFYNTVAREIGNDKNGFYQVNVTTAFRYDDLA